MRNLIQIIEKMGENAYNEFELINVLKNSSLSDEEVNALIEGDSEELAKMLDTRTKIVAFLIPAKDDENDDSESEDTEEDQDKDSEKAVGF